MPQPAVNSQTEIGAPAQQQPAQPQAVSISPLIAQDITAVTVSANSQVINAPAAIYETTSDPLKVEVKPAEPKPEPILETVEAAPGKNAAPANDNELSRNVWAQAEAGTLWKSADKNEPSDMTPTVAFDGMLHSVDRLPGPELPESLPVLHDVARQVMDGMSASTDRLKTSQLIITLKPEHLGEVTVKINIDGDRVTAAFHAASSEVRSILESSLPQLRQEMSQHGWKFDSKGVFGGMQEFLTNQQQQPQAQEQQMFQFAHRSQMGEYDDRPDFTHNVRPQVMTAAAVDYQSKGKETRS